MSSCVARTDDEIPHRWSNEAKYAPWGDNDKQPR